MAQPKRHKKQTRGKRVEGDPCLCTALDHGHDEERCAKPVYGRTRSGRIKNICDDCAHASYINRMLAWGKTDSPRLEIIRRTTRSPFNDLAAPTPREPEQPPPPLPEPGLPAEVDSIWREPF